MEKLLMALVLMPLLVLADQEKVGDVTWTYKVSSERVTVKGVNPCAGKLKIPQTLGGYPVSSIGAAAFSDCEDLTEMVIPEGVADVGAAAFCDCIELTMVTIPSSMVSIGDAAFEGCDSLTTVRVAAGDTEGVKAMIVDSGSGIDVDLLTFVEMLADGGPYTETVDGIEWTFYAEDGKAQVGRRETEDGVAPAVPWGTVGALVIPAILGGCPVTSIGASAFSGCSGLTSVTIPSSVTDIGEFAFSVCSGLTSVTIPSSVTSIGTSAFFGCSGLMSISVNEGNVSYCSVDGILYDKTTTRLICCPNEKTGAVVISEGVTDIGESAFFGCSGLTSVTIPSSVTSIGTSAFFGCSGLMSILVADDSASYCSHDGVLYDGAKTVLFACPGGRTGAFEIPSSVTSIGASAFSGCSGLTSVTIPSSVTSIGASAFSDCSGLTSVTIPDGVTDIGEYAFSGCIGLTSVTIPDGVTSIRRLAFQECCGLESVTIPSSVTSIGEHAFHHCSALTSVAIPSSVTSIGDWAFNDCEGLTSVTIPSSVTSIGYGAFDRCPICIVYVTDEPQECVREYFDWFSEVIYQKIGTTITINRQWDVEWVEEYETGESFWTLVGADPSFGDLVIPDRSWCEEDEFFYLIECIGEWAFADCGELLSVTIPEGVECIGYGAFSGCSRMSSVTIPSSVTHIGGEAFRDCYNLTSVVLPIRFSNLKDIFPDSRSLNVVWIDDGSKSAIAPDACAGMENLKSIVIPASVMNVGDRAFYNCHRLAKVTFEGKAPDVGTEVFNGTPKNLVVSVPASSTGWDGEFASTALPRTWGGRAIAHVGENYDWDKGMVPAPSASSAAVAGTMIVSNVVVHYILNSVQPEFAIQPADDMNFVNIITEVKGSAAVAIPETWAASYPGFAKKFGTDFTQALLKPSGKIGTGGTPMLVWQDYVAGTDPTDEKDVFTASITIVDGKVTISYSPELDDARKAMRRYTTWGKTSLMDTDWTEVQEGHESEFNFFKVSVEMR